MHLCLGSIYVFFLPELFRDVATLHNIISQLVPLLVPSSNSQLKTSSSSFSNTQLQAMRAIANLCYDHGQTNIWQSKQSISVRCKFYICQRSINLLCNLILHFVYMTAYCPNSL